MSKKIEIPMLMHQEKQAAINQLVYDKTGCFVFLKAEQMLICGEPIYPREALFAYCINLYSLYHDYGRRYLDFILASSNLPNGNMYQSALQARMHVEQINSVFRTNYAHGIYSQNIRSRFINTVTNLYLEKSMRDGLFKTWPNYYIKMDDDRINFVVEKIIQESNNLYRYMESWSDEWYKLRGKDALRATFARSKQFEYSIDYSICEQHIPSNMYHKLSALLDVRKSSSSICKWRTILSKEYEAGIINSPSEVYDRLMRLIKAEVSPPERNSVSVAAQYDFDC